MFTSKELQIARMKLQGLMNKEIAQKLGVSDAYISQTLNRLSTKIRGVQDSIELLKNMNVIQEGPKYVMTDKGRRLAKVPKKEFPSLHEVGSTLVGFKKGFFEKTSGNIVAIIGSGQRFHLLGRSESRVTAVTEQREITTSTTSEHMQPIMYMQRSVRTVFT